jgi:hypothetical protein
MPSPELEQRAADLARQYKATTPLYDLPQPSVESSEPTIIAKHTDVFVINHHGIFAKVCWIATILGSLLGVAVIIFGFAVAKGAPQEAVVAALGIACAIIPYCLAKAVSELAK